ncbi:hypothetical protein ZYGM_002760 [Zygosaccharomyces mellis]|uniref:Transcription activator GCR1-like domain-containing protein n=1 Tax=Zygosaccharomyces mellis TaxID=42258 RepID=A0A4C2DZZ8_9SACH|nr:hypothetical protein ZYGM_002760 [Zygosaccharomyces mellis]
MNLDPFDRNRISGSNRNGLSPSSSSSQAIPIFPLDNIRDANDDLYHVLNSQDQQARISSTNISSNFYLITQYILQAYFKVSFTELRSLKLVDLIVDQTYAESLTLRKLNEGASVRSYEYFNTVPRQEDITRCPIFALATYFVIRWSHPNPPVTVENFDQIPLLDPTAISWNRGFQKLNHTKEGYRVSRSVSFEPASELADIIFPWLPSLRQDMEIVDRSNYKLHSFLELFEFMARTIVQDLKFLQLHSQLLPNIVTFVAKFIPDLFQHPKFHNAKPVFSDRHGGVGGKNGSDEDSHFLQLSKRLTTENVRLAQQITQLKTDLSNVQYMCDQILKLQQQQLVNSNHGNNANDSSGNGRGYHRQGSNGVIVLDKNSVNSSIWNNLTQHSGVVGPPGGGVNNNEDPQESLNLAPMLASFPSVNPEMSKKRKLPPPPQPGLSPFPASPGPVLPSVAESPYSKRLRIEDKPTPSQSALDLLLAKTVSSPRFSSIPNSQRLSSRYSSPTAFAMAGSPGAVLPNNPVPLAPQMTQPEIHSHPRNISGLVIQNSPTTAATTDATATETAAAAATATTTAPAATAATSTIPARAPGAVSAIDNPSSKTLNANSLPNTPVVHNGTNGSNANEEAEASASADDGNDDENDDSKALSPKSTEPRPRPPSNNPDNTGANGSNGGKSNKPVEKLGPNRHIKYKLSRDNKTIWDLYTEWYIGLNGQSSIKSLIETYGLRRWKVSDDSHFFPTRRIIMDYIEMECDRGIKLGRFTNPDQPREDIRKIIVGDLEKFRINNGLTLNSLSMYFKNLMRENKEICVFENFKNWSVRAMAEEEKNRYCKRQHTKESL